MALVIPCIRGRMGDTDYYMARMPVRDLIQGVRPATELDRWASMGIEERMQREPNETRIKQEIAPYIANAKDRFFGSLIVLVYRGEIHFENLVRDLKVSIPKAYGSQAEDIGFVTIDGGDLIVLDGQHRLLALEMVLKKTVTGDCSDDVANDTISVTFINHESDQKTRRIFNKLNRYAKTTSRGDNIITSEDDGYAIVTRGLLEDGAPLGLSDAIGESIVNFKSNTLGTRSKQLTTISAVYETVKVILDHEGIKHFDEKHKIVRPSEEELATAAECVNRFWHTVLTRLKPYKIALQDMGSIMKMREDTEPFSLLFKPAAQVTLFQGLTLAMDRGLSLEDAVDRANDIDWRMSSPVWKNIIVNPNGTINAYAEARDRTAELIAYLIGSDLMDEGMLEAFKNKYCLAWGYDRHNPDPESEEPALPQPVIVKRPLLAVA